MMKNGKKLRFVKRRLLTKVSKPLRTCGLRHLRKHRCQVRKADLISSSERPKVTDQLIEGERQIVFLVMKKLRSGCREDRSRNGPAWAEKRIKNTNSAVDLRS